MENMQHAEPIEPLLVHPVAQLLCDSLPQA
jgi:hypothetical protein